MDGKQVFTDLAASRGSDKTAIAIAKTMVAPPPRRGKIGRCLDWIGGRSFIFFVLVLAFACDEGDVPGEDEEDFRDRRPTR